MSIDMNATALNKILTASRSTGTINLSNKSLQEFPPQLLELDALDYDNKRWWEESELTKLDLSHNYMRHLPNEISRLSCLQAVFLCDNEFSTLPVSLFSLESLSRVVHLRPQCARAPLNIHDSM